MATLVSYPESLVLAGNIEPVRVQSSADSFSFILSSGDIVLLDEIYTAGIDGFVDIDIQDIVSSYLKTELPDCNVFEQSGAVATFTLKADEDITSFTAVAGGVRNLATDSGTFLKANFLTWQPQVKSVSFNQPEWLSFYVAEQGCSLVVIFYNIDGTTSEVVLAGKDELLAGKVISVNMQFARVWALGTGDRFGYFDIYIMGNDGLEWTYRQRYILDRYAVDNSIIVCLNSVGGLDTFSLSGELTKNLERESNVVLYENSLSSEFNEWNEIFSVSSGLLSEHGKKWIRELIMSKKAWWLVEGTLKEIALTNPSADLAHYDDSSATVVFRLADESAFINIQHTESVPENIEIPGPDDTLFFLAPRLIDYPDAALDDSWLIPLQSAFEEKWYKASIGGIADYAAKKITDVYGSLWHWHDNLPILNKFGIDLYGKLTWDGQVVGGGNGDGNFVTLDTEQTITGKKTFNVDTVFTGKLYVPSVSGAGIYDIFIDDTGAVSGEVPTASGGLDADAMWEELTTVDATKVIDLSHIPAIPWNKLSGIPDAFTPTAHTHAISEITGLQDSLSALQTADTALENNIAGLANTYVTLATEQTITGKKTFNADAVFAGKLYVPSTSGAGIYDIFIDDTGAVSGEVPTASGGLDVNAMWEELGGSVESKIIDASHLPSSLIYDSELASALGNYYTKIQSDGRYVQQVAGKGLSANDFTDIYKNKLDDIASGAQVNVIETVKLNGTILQVSSKAVNINAVTSLAVPTGLSAGSISSTGKISISLASGYVIPVNSAKFWGRTWDGLSDVSGAIEGATDIDASGTVYAATALVTNKLYIPSTAGNQVYDIFIDDSGAVSGETPSEGIGLDEEAMWIALGGSMSSKVIDISHIPSVPWTKISGKPKTFAPAAHTHPLSQISDLGSTWDAYLKAGIYKRSLTFNGSTYPVMTDVANPSAVAWYAPTAPGTSGQVLQSTGGVPGWISRSDLQHQLFTAGAGCLAIPANANLNDYTTPGVYYCDANATVATWTNSPTSYACSLTVLAAAGVIQILREYGYAATAKEFTRRYYNRTWTAWQTSINSANYTSFPARYMSLYPGNGSHIAQNDAVPGNGQFGIYDVNTAATAGGNDGYIMALRWASGNWCTQLFLDVDPTGVMALRQRGNDNVWTDWYKIWHSGNDGSGSGLDADLLDGQHGSDYLRSFWTTSPGYDASQYVENSFSTFTHGNNAPFAGPLFHLGARGYGVYFNTSYGSDSQLAYRRHGVSNDGGMGSWQYLARITDNVYSATKLQTSRTLWGRPFDGTGNVSGDMTGVGRIVASGPIRTYSINIECDDTGALGSYGGEINRTGFTGPLYLQHRGGSLYICANGGDVGIGTTSPAYKLDVAGEIRAISGITIGGTDDYGWYISTGTRISAGIDVARGVNVGSLLVSNAWADYTKVPANGLYCKGDIWTGGKLFVPSSEGNQKYYIRIE